MNDGIIIPRITDYFSFRFYNMKAEAVSLDSSETSLTLGEKVFNLLPETVRGKLSGRYNREEIARRVLQELGKGKRDDKSLHDGVVSALYLDENIPSSIKKSLLKHLGNMVPAQENETLKFFKQVNEKLGDQQASKGKTLGKSSATEDFLKGEISQQNLTPVDTHRRDDNAIDREVRAIGVDMYPDHSERLEQKKYIARVRASKRSKKATAVDVPNDASVFGGTDALPDDQKVSPPHEGEGYFGSPDYKQAIDDAAEENIKAEKGGIVPGGNPLESPFSNNGVEDKSETDFDYQASLGDVPDMKMDMSDDSKDDLDKDDADFSLQGDVPDLERFEKKEGAIEASEKSDPEKVVESLEELQERVDRLKNDADAARNLLFSCRRKNGDQWKRIKRFFSFPREKEAPKPVIEEWKMLEVAWKHKLTLYKDARVELAKRKVAEEGSQGKDVGAVMAETIRELDFRGRVENYNAWKDAVWSDKKDSWLLRAIGRAKDWGESYRQLDWKKRAAISALVFGAGATGVAVGSVGLVGLGAASGVAVRLLGSYAAGRGLYEYLEGRENKNAVKFHEAALSHVEQSDDLGFLDHRTRDYADRMQKDFERMTQKNRKRVWASVAAGTLLFAGGTAFSLAHAASAAERVVESGGGGRVVQEALLAKGADVPGVPHADTTKEMLATAKKLAIEGQVKSVPVPSVAEVAVPVSDTSGLLSDSVGSGIIDHGSSVEVAGDIGKSLADMKIAAVPRGGSFERVLIEKLMGVGVAKEEAGKLAHQAMLDLAEKSGRPFEMFNDIQPGAEIQYEIGPDKSLSVFGVTREAGGEAIQRIADSTLEGGHASTVGQTIKESLPLSPKPADAVPVPSVQMPSPDPFPKMPEVNLESPQDIFERVLPKVPQAPSLEDTLSGNVSLDTSVSAPSLESLPVEASAPVHDFESLDLSVPGGEYLKNIGTVVKERLTFLPLSETQKDLIENIFSARIPTAGTEPTTSSVLFVRDALGKALFSSGDVERWMRVDIEQVRERVNKAVYAGLVRIGGESLRIKEMVAEGETVKGWLTKMARHILTHPIEPAK